MSSPELNLIDQTTAAPKSDPSQPTVSPKRLLVIDDLPEVGALVLAIARRLGYVCDYAPGFEAFKSLLAGDPDVIVVDLAMPEIDGIEVLRFLGERQCRAGVLLLSNSDRRVLSVAEQMAQAMNLRVIGVMRKPFARTALESVLRREQTGTTRARPHTPVLPTITKAALRRAIDDRQIVLHYQPQVEIATGAVAGLELLMRLQHPQHGLVYPDAFIGLAESWGLIDELTWVVVDQTLEHHKTLSAIGWAPTLSINVSAISLRDLKLPDALSQRAAAAGIPTARIILEITESGLVKNVAPALDILARLRLRGVNLSIDDFGTGFSMMHQLKRIPATEVKIDKAFIGMMAFDPDAEAIVRKTIELGHDLGMTVVAEGVETAEQLQMLRHLKCDLAQGYLFARPMPLQDVLSWRETHLAGYQADALAP